MSLLSAVLGDASDNIAEQAQELFEHTAGVSRALFDHTGITQPEIEKRVDWFESFERAHALSTIASNAQKVEAAASALNAPERERIARDLLTANARVAAACDALADTAARLAVIQARRDDARTTHAQNMVGAQHAQRQRVTAEADRIRAVHTARMAQLQPLADAHAAAAPSSSTTPANTAPPPVAKSE